MLKMLGVFMVIATTTLFSASLASREKYRLHDLEQLQRAILLMKNRIAYLGEPLQQILESIAWKTDGVIGNVLGQISLSMAERDGVSGEEIWERIWREHAKKSYLTSEDMKEVIHFGRTLGFLERAQQEGSMDLLLLYLRGKEAEIKRRLEKNGKLYYSMGILAGLLIVVVLI